MKVVHIETKKVKIPLIKPFKTALRTATHTDSVFIKVICDNGIVGYGESAATPMITGETADGIIAVIQQCILPRLKNENVLAYEDIMTLLQKSCVKNTSAKAGVDIALHDCISKYYNVPLYQFLGGTAKGLQTDYTVSVDTPPVMVKDAKQLVEDGFRSLKIKVGKDEIGRDISRIQNIEEGVQARLRDVSFRLDANQGWSVKESIRAISYFERKGFPIEFIEQPVLAHDWKGLKEIKQHVQIPIMADESVYTSKDAKLILEEGCADYINIKLMKSGGLYEASKIVRLCEAYGVPCMIGSMIETPLAIRTACHFGASFSNIHFYDLDAYFMVQPQDDLPTLQVENKHTIHLDTEVGIGHTEKLEGRF